MNGTEPRIIYGMSAADYHSDKDGPRLSQSLATLCCNQSPLHAYQAHPLLGAAPYTYEPSTDDGSIIHALVLEPENELFHEIGTRYDSKHERAGEVVTDFKTKAAQLERQAALDAGKIPMLSEKLGIYRYKAKALRSRFKDVGLTFDGDSEVVIYWTETTEFGPVRCRARLDHLIITDDGATIIDLKSAKDVHPHALKRSIWEYGYDIQHAAYTRAVAAVFPALAGRINMPFAFGELDKPYAVNPITLSGEFKRLGETRWERGLNRWAKCLYENRWTAYDGGVIEPPAYALAQEMGEP